MQHGDREEAWVVHSDRLCWSKLRDFPKKNNNKIKCWGLEKHITRRWLPTLSAKEVKRRRRKGRKREKRSEEWYFSGTSSSWRNNAYYAPFLIYEVLLLKIPSANRQFCDTGLLFFPAFLWKWAIVHERRGEQGSGQGRGGGDGGRVERRRIGGGGGREGCLSTAEWSTSPSFSTSSERSLLESC